MSRAVTARFPGHRRLPVRVKCRLPTQKGCVKVCDLLLHAGSECHRKERGPGLSARLRLPPKPGARGRSLRPLGNAPGSLAPARRPLRAVSVPRATVTHRGAAGTAFSDSARSLRRRRRQCALGRFRAFPGPTSPPFVSPPPGHGFGSSKMARAQTFPSYAAEQGEETPQALSRPGSYGCGYGSGRIQ